MSDPVAVRRVADDKFTVKVNDHLMEFTEDALRKCLDAILSTEIPLDPGAAMDLAFLGQQEIKIPARSIPDIIRCLQNALT